VCIMDFVRSRTNKNTIFIFYTYRKYAGRGKMSEVGSRSTKIDNEVYKVKSGRLFSWL